MKVEPRPKADLSATKILFGRGGNTLKCRLKGGMAKGEILQKPLRSTAQWTSRIAKFKNCMLQEKPEIWTHYHVLNLRENLKGFKFFNFSRIYVFL